MRAHARDARDRRAALCLTYADQRDLGGEGLLLQGRACASGSAAPLLTVVMVISRGPRAGHHDTCFLFLSQELARRANVSRPTSPVNKTDTDGLRVC